MEWTFRCYCASRDVIRQWYDNQTPEAQAEFDAALHYLKQRSQSEWERPWFGQLSRECSGLGEIRFSANRVEHRVIGYYGPKGWRMHFTLLMPAKEKDRKFVPSNACATALRRMTEVESHQTGYPHVCNFT